MTKTKFTLPALPKSFLALKFKKIYEGEAPSVPLPKNSFPAEITSARYIAQHSLVKTKIELLFHIKDIPQPPFQPGDAVGVVCQNPPEEVDWLLERLGLEDSDAVCELHHLEGATPRQKITVDSLPSCSTPRILLSCCCEIRAVCKKVFVRCLAEHATDPEDREGLLELCSREGADKYRRAVEESGLSVTDLLQRFPTCRPTLALLLEHLPRLCPRYYSLASSPLKSPQDFTIVFTEATLPGTPTRLGVCTGWFERQSESLLAASLDVESAMDRLSLSPKPIPCWLYHKEDHSFPLPSSPGVPLILVGPGVGVAPFLGYLQHRQHQREQGLVLGDIWLFYGCRHSDYDYIYRRKLEKWLEQGVLTQLLVVSSRDNDGPQRYVQHAISDKLPELLPLLIERKAHVRVCGDAVAMATEVLKTFKLGYQHHTGCTVEEADQ